MSAGPRDPQPEPAAAHAGHGGARGARHQGEEQARHRAAQETLIFTLRFISPFTHIYHNRFLHNITIHLSMIIYISV